MPRGRARGQRRARAVGAMLANLFGRRDRFTPANLRRLVDVLARTPSATPGNSASLVETFREIAELMIYGDQNDPTFFDVFVEHRVLAHFSRFIKQSGGRRGSGLTLQLLQTLSIMIQNTREETSLFYLFSNDHIPRELIACDFDFDDEEVMAYYISFLKTVSLKLNVRTVQFFFFTVADDRGNASSRVESSYSFGGGTDDSADEESSSAAPSDAFPLYERASRFLDHPESMVRAAARTTVLNAAAVPDARVRGYLLSDAAWSRCLPRVVAAAGAATAALSEDALRAPARGREARSGATCSPSSAISSRSWTTRWRSRRPRSIRAGRRRPRASRRARGASFASGSSNPRSFARSR